MQRIVHQLDLTVLELYLPSLKDQSQALSLLVSLRDTSFKSQFPMDAPVIFEEERLVAGDFIRIGVMGEEEEVGRVEFLLRDLFPQSLEGDVEVWLKVTEMRGGALSPGREDSSRGARMRVEINLREVAKKEEREAHRPRQAVTLPKGLDQCGRCEYLEKLTAAQQNELQALEESENSFQQVSFLLEKYSEEQPSALQEGEIDESQRPPPAVTAEEAEHLRLVIVSLNEKLKSLQAVQGEVRALRADLAESHERRKELEKLVVSTTEQLKKQSEKQSELHSQFLRERQRSIDLLRQQHQKYREKCQEEDNLLSQIAVVKSTIQRLRCESASHVQIQSHISAVSAQTKESERQRQALKQQYAKGAADYEARIKENRSVLEKLDRDKAELEMEMSRLTTEVQAMSRGNEKLERGNGAAREMVGTLESHLEGSEADRKLLAEKIGETEKTHDKAVEAESELQKLAGEFGRRFDEVLYQNQRTRDEKGKLTAALNDTEGVIEQKNNQIHHLITEKFALTNEIAALEQFLCVQEDALHIASTVTRGNEENRALREQLLRELSSLSQVLLGESEKSLAGSRLMARIHAVRAEKEAEVAVRRERVEEVAAKRWIYCATEGDEVDEALEKVINGMEIDMQIPILREDAGSYTFGSRHIGLQLVENTLVVKVGGGRMPLLEFLETYTPLETDKVEAKKVEHTTRHLAVKRKVETQEDTEAAQSRSEARTDNSPSRGKKQSEPLKSALFFPPARRSLSPSRQSLTSQQP